MNTFPQIDFANQLKILSINSPGAKAPEGDGKKYYSVGCYTAKDWDYIHEVLMKDGTLEDNIPCGCIECSDLKEHSATRATYLLTDAEAEELRKHPKVKYVLYDSIKYPGEYPAVETSTRQLRYTDKSRQYRQFGVGNVLYTGSGAAEINRSGYQLTRCVQRENPWKNQSPVGVHNDRVEHYGTGKDVDVIITDNGVWVGHPEFSNATGNGPQDYEGGNVLPGNGTSDVLDLVLDGPYHIDPDWFNADPGARLTTRWDGTTVPVETVARDWWSNGAQRSSQFASIGTVSIGSSYTRANHCGTNSAIPSNGSNADHGTPCAANAYGRTQGWAYNANKWSLTINIGTGAVGITSGVTTEQSFDIVKLFHQNKPTDNPTVSSNSWASVVSYSTTSYTLEAKYQFRGGGEITFTNATAPNFLRLTNYTVGAGSVGIFHYPIGEGFSNGLTDAAQELINSGVILVAAAGNFGQKLVLDNHLDYDNYIAGYDTGPTLESFIITNRPGFPAQAGEYISNGQHVYPGIVVGALDDGVNPTNGREQKVNYSNRGNAIDFYVPGDGTLSAGSGASAIISRSDIYSGLGAGIGSDTFFSGTSSACPVGAGLIATKLEYNRSWGWQDVKNWIRGTNQPTGITTVGHQIAADFYFGAESTTANDANWLDYNSLEGGDPIVLWDAPTGSEPKTIGLTFKNE